MNIFRNLIGCIFTIGGMIAWLSLLHAQETPFQSQSINDIDAILQAIEATTPLPAESATNGSNFYSAQHSPTSAEPWPPLPGDVLGLDVWPLGDGVFLLDDRDLDYSALSGGRMQSMSMDPNDPGDGDTNGYAPNLLPAFTPTTNDLWLQITGKTNTTAFLVIHPPWNVTDDVYDLLYCTNLAPPIQWQWLLRTDPRQTNLVVNNATDSQGFYRLAPPNDLIANGSLGTNFWVAFMYLYNQNEEYLSLYISSPVATTGTVTIPSTDSYPASTNTFALAAGAVTNILINPSLIPNFSHDDLVLTNGIHITATQPVSVYAFSYSQYTSAAFTCYPTPLLGTKYCLMARSAGTTSVGLYSSRFVIVATADDTTVSITPSLTAYLAGSSYDYTSNYAIYLPQRGQTYQIGSDSNTNDVTGTLIESDKPVGVFAGASSAYVPDNIVAGNPLVQQQLPVDTWGTQVVSIGFAGRLYGDMYRILAAYSNTVVTITDTNGSFTTNLMAGMFCDTNLAGPVQFQASKPIQVAHFENGWQFDHPDTQEGDPCEILLPPTGHYLQTNVVYSPFYYTFSFNVGFDENYLNLIVPQSAIANTAVNGSILAATNFVVIGSSGYYGAQISATNQIYKVSSSQPVGVEVYGFGAKDAYGYFGGVVK